MRQTAKSATLSRKTKTAVLDTAVLDKVLPRRTVLGWLAASLPVGIVAAHAAPRHLLSPPMPADVLGMSSQAPTPVGDSVAAVDWASFKRRFMLPEGRVVDTGNNGVSHTEGQGIGMLAAVHFNDRETFDKLLDWTRQHLSRATDHLHAWRYKPNQAMAVDDPNNATDGDMLIAWALFEAARTWDEPQYREAAVRIAENIRMALVRPMGDRLVLLPGTYGFVHADKTVVNPSYYVFPALHRFATEMPHPTWTRLWKDGVDLMREARFGRWGLTPDWVDLNHSSGPQMAEGWPPRFSFDAIRVPLYMSWVGLSHEPVVQGASDFWNSYAAGSVPAWTDLQTNAGAPYGQNCGIKAVQAFSQAMNQGHATADIPSSVGAQDYYAAALTMLAHVANATHDTYSTPIA